MPRHIFYSFLPLQENQNRRSWERKWYISREVTEFCRLTASCYEIGHTTALEESTVFNRREEQLREGLHFSQTNPHYCSLPYYLLPLVYMNTNFIDSLRKKKTKKVLFFTFVLFPISKPSTNPVSISKCIQILSYLYVRWTFRHLPRTGKKKNTSTHTQN